MLKKIKSFIYTLSLSGLLFLLLIVSISLFNIPGNYKLLSVQSGSMEPTIKTGSLIVVKPIIKYEKGDIITVSNPLDNKKSMTHRIVGKIEKNNTIFYTTKGDANNAVDSNTVAGKDIVGKVIFIFPWLGYFIAFSKTLTGLVVLVIVPSIIIIFSELLKIKDEVRNFTKKKESIKEIDVSMLLSDNEKILNKFE